MTVLLFAGSPSEHSRAAALLDAVQQRLQRQGANVERLHIRDLSPQALILADFSHRSIRQVLRSVADAQVIVAATPVSQTTYSGLLKLFLDLFQPNSLAGKTVLPLITGGSLKQALDLHDALRPVLEFLGTRRIWAGIHTSDEQITRSPDGSYRIAPEIGARLDEAVTALLLELALPVVFPSTSHQFENVHFSQVRCSV